MKPAFHLLLHYTMAGDIPFWPEINSVAQSGFHLAIFLLLFLRARTTVCLYLIIKNSYHHIRFSINILCCCLTIKYRHMIMHD